VSRSGVVTLVSSCKSSGQSAPWHSPELDVCALDLALEANNFPGADARKLAGKHSITQRKYLLYWLGLWLV
jgi:hypothetical protein